MATASRSRPAEAPDEFRLPARFVPVEWGGELESHEELLRLWRRVAEHGPDSARDHGPTFLAAMPVWLAGQAGQARRLAADVLAGTRFTHPPSRSGHGGATDLPDNAGSLAPQVTWTLPLAGSLVAGERVLRQEVRLALNGDGGSRRPIDRPEVREALGRSAAMLAAVESAAVLGSRAVHALTGELSVVSTVLRGLVPTLAASVAAGLAVEPDRPRPLVPDDPPVDVPAPLEAQFPWLVHGFAHELVEYDGLAEAARLGTPQHPLDPARLALQSRGGCSLVQALPGYVRGLAGRGADDEVQHLAKTVLATGDELHRRMAESGQTVNGAPTDPRLDAGYGLLFTASACLALWTAQAATATGRPLWEEDLWLRAALRELLVRLLVLLGEPTYAVEETAAAGLLGDRCARAVESGAAITPFPAR